LAGITVGVKDIFDTSDMPTTYGSAAFANHRPQRDASAVAKLRAAGALIMGKTVTTEFAHQHAGPTTNPHSVDRTPGGSSSGSAAAVADEMVTMALGSQTGGSTIRPAAFCGIVGFKPTHGKVSLEGVGPLSVTMDTIGLMARSMSDICLLSSVLLENHDLVQAPATPRVAWYPSPEASEADPDALRAILDGTQLDLSDEAATARTATGLQTAMSRYRSEAQRMDSAAGASVVPVYNDKDESWTLRIERHHHGNVRVSTVDAHFLLSADYRTLVDCALTVGGLVTEGAEIRRGDGDRQRAHAVIDFRDAMRWLLTDAERNVGRQRYKGLGEMNAVQLWETTMDASVRRLLRVQIEDAIAADQIFTKLMGDVVEPRRAFIEQNALGARNIDV
jgi:hypothetical protein